MDPRAVWAYLVTNLLHCLSSLIDCVIVFICVKINFELLIGINVLIKYVP